jgi:serine protease Do
MARFLIHLFVLLLIGVFSGLVYFAVIGGGEDRYDLLDLLRRRPLTAVIGVKTPLVAQGAAAPLLRAEPLDLNNLEVLTEVNRAVSDLTDAVVPSVVSIDTTTNVNVTRVIPTDPFGFFGYRQNESYAAPGLGSGVIVTAEGHIVTNHHVVAGVDAIRVTLHDGSQFDAEWIGSDPNVDIAVLQLKAPEGGTLPPLQPLAFGDSGKVRVGEMVLAVGNPFGLSETVTQGIISAKQRELNDGANEYFQVDAVINPGNSGGPLVNVKGEIIGINVAIFTGQEDVRVWQGIGLAIPANEAKEVFEAIVLGRPLIRGYLGLEVDNISRNYAIALGLSSTQGAVITDVTKGSPAEEAGLKPGDVIVKFDGKAIRTAEETLSRIRGKKAGEVAQLTVLRKGQSLEAAVKAIAKSDTNTLKLRSDIAASGQAIAEALGISVANLNGQQRQNLGLPDGAAAILITDVKSNSQAAQRFQAGDLIHRINQDPVNDVATFYDLLGSLPQDKTSVMVLSREGRVIRAFLNP